MTKKRVVKGKKNDGVPFVVEIPAKGGAALVWKSIPVEELRKSLYDATESLASAFEGIQKVGGFELSEVVIGMEVNGEGGVSFIGSAKVGAAASLQLKFIPPK